MRYLRSSPPRLLVTDTPSPMQPHRLFSLRAVFHVEPRGHSSGGADSAPWSRRHVGCRDHRTTRAFGRSASRSTNSPASDEVGRTHSDRAALEHWLVGDADRGRAPAPHAPRALTDDLTGLHVSSGRRRSPRRRPDGDPPMIDSVRSPGPSLTVRRDRLGVRRFRAGATTTPCWPSPRTSSGDDPVSSDQPLRSHA